MPVLWWILIAIIWIAIAFWPAGSLAGKATASSGTSSSACSFSRPRSSSLTSSTTAPMSRLGPRLSASGRQPDLR